MKKSDPHSKFTSNCTRKEQHVILHNVKRWLQCWWWWWRRWGGGLKLVEHSVSICKSCSKDSHVIIHCFYVVLFSALEQTHWANVAWYTNERGDTVKIKLQVKASKYFPPHTHNGTFLFSPLYSHRWPPWYTKHHTLPVRQTGPSPAPCSHHSAHFWCPQSGPVSNVGVRLA